MDEKLERVARAIFAAGLPDQSDVGAVADKLWAIWHGDREKAIRQARAAIAALDAPNPAA